MDDLGTWFHYVVFKHCQFEDEGLKLTMTIMNESDVREPQHNKQIKYSIGDKIGLHSFKFCALCFHLFV